MIFRPHIDIDLPVISDAEFKLNAFPKSASVHMSFQTSDLMAEEQVWDKSTRDLASLQRAEQLILSQVHMHMESASEQSNRTTPTQLTKALQELQAKQLESRELD